jgi:hypothetical protein
MSMNDAINDSFDQQDEYDAGFAPESVEPEQSEAETSAPVARRGLPFIIHWPTLVVIILLLVIAALALMSGQDGLPTTMALWWPLAIAVPAAIWFVVSLARSRPQGLIASTAVFGVGLGLLLSTRGIVPQTEGVTGITFIAIGTGIMLRGLLLRNQPIG